MVTEPSDTKQYPVVLVGDLVTRFRADHQEPVYMRSERVFMIDEPKFSSLYIAKFDALPEQVFQNMSAAERSLLAPYNHSALWRVGKNNIQNLVQSDSSLSSSIPFAAKNTVTAEARAKVDFNKASTLPNTLEHAYERVELPKNIPIYFSESDDYNLMTKAMCSVAIDLIY
jgi:hypothetical protein